MENHEATRTPGEEIYNQAPRIIEIKVSPQKQNEIPLMASQTFSNESFGSSKGIQEHEPRLLESNVGLEKQLNIQGFQFKNSLWHPS